MRRAHIHRAGKVIEILENSLPAAQVQVLSAALRATRLDSASEPERHMADGLSGVSLSDPSPASDSPPAPSASPPQSEPSVARVSQTTVRLWPLPQPRGCDTHHQAAVSLVTVSWWG